MNIGNTEYAWVDQINTLQYMHEYFGHNKYLSNFNEIEITYRYV